MTATSADLDERDVAEPFAYLTTTGRTSGLPRTIEIWFALDGATLYLLAGGRERAQWVRNLQRDPRVTVRLRDRELRGRARVLAPGEDDDATARRLLVEKYGQGRDLSRWGRSALPVAVDLSRG
ncbi:MAG: hypothetical protein AVDCRST_MAG79-2360 [uncultured Thermoleophilia bacterium]|uniref:Nitroreductase family deazaflavin-dependent oxidoreductase n=1 Tax=uncultured Thermoleophilia bacterium TaxID=1497501 RepID=A0A6J4UCF0_9ACTN|nr:MAG: hypothetical protein AVDCRST_MAG79-2360 [uncultured Thermoleophilia bacterium]